MINSLQNINLYKSSEKQSTQKATNIKPSIIKNTMSFSGKSFVLQKLFGEKILIPRAVHDAIQSVKNIGIAFEDAQLQTKSVIGNGVYLGNDLFLSVEHLFESLNKAPIKKQAVGKLNIIKNRIFNNTTETNSVIHSIPLDLAVFKRESRNIKINEFFSKSKPIPFAESMPKQGETIYMLGHNCNPLLRSPKAIPMEFHRNIGKQKVAYHSNDDTTKTGESVDFYRSMSDIIEKNSHRFEGTGMSGSPIVNSKGELIGITLRAHSTEENGIDRPSGVFYFIGIDQIKEFLSKNNIQYK